MTDVKRIRLPSGRVIEVDPSKEKVTVQEKEGTRIDLFLEKRKTNAEMMERTK